MSYFLLIVLLSLFTACSTLHLPNTGFEDAIAVQPEQRKLTLGTGNIQSLNFNNFENSEDKKSVSHGNVASLIFAGAMGLSKNLEVSASTYSIIPFPGLVGLKYYFYSGEDSPVSASVTIKYGYSMFGNSSPFGGCGKNGSSCLNDANGRWVTGNLSAFVLGVPVGYQFSDKLRVTLNPQITYFDGKYTLSKKISDTETLKTATGLYGLRKTLGVNGLYQFAKSWDAQLSCQVHDYTWNGIGRRQDVSAYVGVSYFLGGEGS